MAVGALRDHTELRPRLPAARRRWPPSAPLAVAALPRSLRLPAARAGPGATRDGPRSDLRARGRVEAIALGAGLGAGARRGAQRKPGALPTIAVTNGEAAVGEAVSPSRCHPVSSRSFVVRGEATGRPSPPRCCAIVARLRGARDGAARGAALRLEPALNRRTRDARARERRMGSSLAIDGRPSPSTAAAVRRRHSPSRRRRPRPRWGLAVSPSRRMGGIVTDDDAPSAPSSVVLVGLGRRRLRRPPARFLAHRRGHRRR